jgi:hypothetical protein
LHSYGGRRNIARPLHNRDTSTQIGLPISIV